MTIKSAIMLCCLVLSASKFQAQLVEIVSEVYAEHDGIEIPDLEGMTTYRVYAVLTNESDEVSAVYGDLSIPLSLTSVDGFFQSDFGASTGWSVNPAFFAFAAEAEFDSWITLGVSNSTEVTGQPNTIGMDEPFTAFNAGGDMIVNSANGGSWFTLFGDTQAQAGPDLKVMIAQLTTSGSFSGIFNVQIFINGNQAESAQYYGIPFSSNEGAVFGCMDPDATNYNADATESGETCLYPCAISLTLDEVNHASCTGAGDGEIFVSAEGEQLGVLYGINGATPNLAVGHFDDLEGGVYTIAVIDGAGCEASIEVEIDVPSPIVLNASLTESVSCAGDSDGVISGSAQGGAGGFQFSLSSDFMDSNTELYFDGLAAGFYTVFVQDANGCVSSSVSISIADPSPLNVSVSGGQNGIAAATCSDSEDGIIVVLTMGGAGNQSSMEFSTNGVDFAPGNVIYIAGGTYTIYAMDVNGCIGQSDIEYTVGAPAPTEWTIDTDSPTCFGADDGSVFVTATGENGGFSFDLDGLSFDGPQFETFVSAGTYGLTATDVLGCQAFQEIVVEEPDAISWEIAILEEASCSNDFIATLTIELFGGSSPYTVTWDDGAQVFSAGSTWNSSTGVFAFQVDDANGCSASGEFMIEGVPILMGFEPEVTQPTCYGNTDGSIVPDSDFSFTEWNVAWSGTSSGVQEPFTSIDNLMAGAYQIELSSPEFPECSALINVEMDQPEAISILVNAAGPICPNELTGIITAEAYNTQGDFGWMLNGVPFSEASSFNAVGFPAGTYTLSTEDAMGCTGDTIVSLEEPTSLGMVPSFIVHPTSFNNGSIELDLNEGLSVQWYDGAGLFLGQESELSGLQSGTYLAEIANGVGCVDEQEFELDFPGCSLSSAEDWPFESSGFFPMDEVVWLLGQEIMPGSNTTTSEWVLRIPSSINDGGLNYPVVSFVLDSIMGIPQGTDASVGWGDELQSLESGCIEFSGIPTLAGEYEVNLTGTLSIALFGSSFNVEGFTFLKTVRVEASEDLIAGCTYAWASNFNSFADFDDGSCTIDGGCPNPEACNFNALSAAPESACDFSCLGCTYVDAENYNLEATQDNGTCIFDLSSEPDGVCLFDFDDSGTIGSTDLLVFLEAYGYSCP